MFFFHKKPEFSILRRMSVAKSIGLALGLLAGFIVAPLYLGTGLTLPLQWGLLFWGLTFGAIIGLAGVITRCPVWQNCPLYRSAGWRPIFRGGFIGAWLEMVGVLLMGDMIKDVMCSFAGWEVSTSFLLIGAVIEGFIFGAFIDWVSTKLGGEGKSLLV